MWGDKNGLMNVQPQNWRITIFISRAPSLRSLVKVFRLFTVRLINHILKGMMETLISALSACHQNSGASGKLL